MSDNEIAAKINSRWDELERLAEKDLPASDLARELLELVDEQ